MMASKGCWEYRLGVSNPSGKEFMKGFQRETTLIQVLINEHSMVKGCKKGKRTSGEEGIGEWKLYIWGYREIETEEETR